MPTRPSSRRLACLGFLLAAADAAAALAAGMTIEQAVERLERDGLRVFYSTDLVKPWMRVRSRPAAATPVDALEEILAPVGLALKPGPAGSWLIVRAPERPPPSLSASPAAPAQPGPPLLPQSDAPALDEIVVAASQYELTRSPGASRTLLVQTDLEHVPDLGDDAIRAVSRLPGTASNGIGALANVRGGETGETLIRLDGLRLYEPFHLSDFQSVFSSLDPRVIDSMDVFTGGFPAAYGDRMSGVIDVRSITPPDDLYHEVAVSFFNSSLLSAGRFAGGDAAWVASARRSNLDLLYETFSAQPDRPRYSDAFAKLSYDVGDALRITANALDLRDDIAVSDDVDREETARADHRDRYRWLRLDHRVGRGFAGATLLAHTRLDSERAGTSAKEGISRGALLDVQSFSIDSVESAWTKRAGERFLLGFGAEAASLEGRYDYRDDVDFELLFDADGAPDEPHRSRSVSVHPEGKRYAVFGSARYVATPRLTVELGLRRDRETLGATRGATLAPRLGLHYRLTGATTLRASWGRYFQSQGIDELAAGDGELVFSKPQRSDHLIVGLDHLFPSGIGLRVEAYDKSMTSLRPRYENLLNSLVLLPELKPDRIRIEPSGARARGLELLLDGDAAESLRWWLGYTWSRVTDRVDGEDVPRSWDQTHALTTGLTWDTPKWTTSLGVIYRSGWPTTPIALSGEEVDAVDGPIPVVSPLGRNSTRMGSYLSVDVRMARNFELEHSSVSVSLEVTNLFDRANPCCVEYESGGEDDEGDLTLESLDNLPRIPSVGFIWKF